VPDKLIVERCELIQLNGTSGRNYNVLRPNWRFFAVIITFRLASFKSIE
jgi:hypothetical protein